MEKSKRLYQGLILEYNRSPLYFEKRGGAGVELEAWNPVCGDKFKLYLDLNAGKVEQASFHGYGCAVSKASASVLMKKIQGLPLDDLAALVAGFLAHFQAGAVTETADPELAAFLPAREFPGRLRCATLAWEALADYLQQRTAAQTAGH